MVLCKKIEGRPSYFASYELAKLVCGEKLCLADQVKITAILFDLIKQICRSAFQSIDVKAFFPLIVS